MEPDVQGQSAADTQNQPQNAPTGSEAESTQDSGGRGGDVTEALRQAREAERQAKQQLQQILAQQQDQAYIYERARALGMTDDAGAAPPETPPPQREEPKATVQAPPPMTRAEVLAFVDYQSVMKEYPELTTNTETLDQVEYYVARKGLTWSQAAEKVVGPSKAAAAQRTVADQVDTAKSQATTAAPTGTSTQVTNADREALNTQLHNRQDPQAQRAALFEMLRAEGLPK